MATVNSKRDVFLEKVLGAGKVIPDPKNYIADFVGFKAVYYGRTFWKKCPKRGGEVIANPKNFLANLRILTNFQEKTQCNFQKGTGGSRPFGTFQKKHPYLGRQSSLNMRASQLYFWQTKASPLLRTW